jgi:hypothetical protein
MVAGSRSPLLVEPAGLPDAGRIDAPLPPDAGSGVFASESAPIPGTYAIAGAEADPTSCGVCVFLLSDLTISGGQITDFGETLFATSGTVTLTSI